MQKKKTLLSFWEIMVLILISIAIMFTPILLAKPTSFFSLNDEGLARIGTALSITSPFIGIGGSILVYIAFKVQYRANQDIREQFQQQSNDEMFFRLFDSTKNHFKPILPRNAEKLNNQLSQNEAQYAKRMLMEDPTVIDKMDWAVIYSLIKSENELIDSKEQLIDLLKSDNEVDKEEVIYTIPQQELRYIFVDLFYLSSYKFKTKLYSEIYNDIKDNDHNVDSYFLNLINLVNFIIKNKSNEFYKDFFLTNLTNFEKRVIMHFCWTHFSNEKLKNNLKELDIFQLMPYHSELFYIEPDFDTIRNEVEFAYHRGF